MIAGSYCFCTRADRLPVTGRPHRDRRAQARARKTARAARRR